MARTIVSQSKHNQRVEIEARKYLAMGYTVDADLTGWSKPPTIYNRIPDVFAKTLGHILVVEFETPDSVNSSDDIEQQKAFQRWANEYDNREFRRVVTD